MGRLACLGNEQANSDYSMQFTAYPPRGPSWSEHLTVAARDSYGGDDSDARVRMGSSRRTLQSARFRHSEKLKPPIEVFSNC